MNANNLKDEKSPYLKQHRFNPVAWYPWGEKAFQAAVESNKPIFLSIGYSTCYWCHVMEKDSFENEAVAEVLNRHFIAIKVDREERPDVDQIYMDAVVGLTGHGGWPMSVFLTPELKPFYGATFIPRQHFIPLLEKIAEVWQNDPQNILSSAEQLTDYLQPSTSISRALEEHVYKIAIERFVSSFDSLHGGFGTAPKFPPATAIRFLLRQHLRQHDSRILPMVEKTLQEMALQGLFDQLGGGFHRYSTDAAWIVPHFEKMLYDNALLVPAYLEAFQVTKNEFYREVAERTLDYLVREMRDIDGGFFSAEDAGEVGAEGEFYVWSAEELEKHRELLTSLASDLTFKVNFEGKSIIPLRSNTTPLSTNTITALQKLRTIREKRPRPHKDTKILTSWNGLTLSAFAKAAQVLNRADYTKIAEDIATFLRSKLYTGTDLMRRYCDGEAAIPGFLEDYAYLIQGLLDLYETTFDLSHLRWAYQLQTRQDQLFWDVERKGYFFAAPDPRLIAKKKDVNDGATPAGNSISALNLLRLYYYTGESSLKERADETMALAAPLAERYPSAFSSLLIAFEMSGETAKQIVLAGAEVHSWAKAIHQYFIPNKVLGAATEAEFSLLSNKRSDNNAIFICQNRSCQAPIFDLDTALRELVRTEGQQ